MHDNPVKELMRQKAIIAICGIVAMACLLALHYYT